MTAKTKLVPIERIQSISPSIVTRWKKQIVDDQVAKSRILCIPENQRRYADIDRLSDIARREKAHALGFIEIPDAGTDPVDNRRNSEFFRGGYRSGALVG